MPHSLPKMVEKLGRLTSWHPIAGGDSRLQPATDEQPFREEIYSLFQLEHHAKVLAGQHELATGVAPDRPHREA